MSTAYLTPPATLLSAALLACGAGNGVEPQTAPPADLPLVNGYVYTVDENRTVAEAVAVREGKIVFVGSSAAARAQEGPDTRVVDLSGA